MLGKCVCATFFAYFCAMKTFKDLTFVPGIGRMKRAELFFENGYGISVLTGPGSYTDEDRPYEAAVLDRKGRCVNVPGLVKYYLTEEEVNSYMELIQSM